MENEAKVEKSIFDSESDDDTSNTSQLKDDQIQAKKQIVEAQDALQRQRDFEEEKALEAQNILERQKALDEQKILEE